MSDETNAVILHEKLLNTVSVNPFTHFSIATSDRSLPIDDEFEQKRFQLR